MVNDDHIMDSYIFLRLLVICTLTLVPNDIASANKRGIKITTKIPLNRRLIGSCIPAVIGFVIFTGFVFSVFLHKIRKDNQNAGYIVLVFGYLSIVGLFYFAYHIAVSGILSTTYTIFIVWAVAFLVFICGSVVIGCAVQMDGKLTSRSNTNGNGMQHVDVVVTCILLTYLFFIILVVVSYGCNFIKRRYTLLEIVFTLLIVLFNLGCLILLIIYLVNTNENNTWNKFRIPIMGVNGGIAFGMLICAGGLHYFDSVIAYIGSVFKFKNIAFRSKHLNGTDNAKE